MKKVLVCIALVYVAMCSQISLAGEWVESAQTDFADGFFDSNIFTSDDGNDGGCIKTAPGAFYDLNKDGRPDLVISNMHDDVRNFNINSKIYWGKHDWTYSADSCQELPTHGATGNSVADLNKDGNLDIVFSSYNDNVSYCTNSLIYWGSKDGFHLGDTTGLPTMCAHANYVVDLNNDGHLDIIFANHKDGDFSNNVNSYIYWGSNDGYSPSNRTELVTIGATDIAVADLNKDGRLDLVFSNRQGVYNSSFTFNLPSYIYYGQGTGGNVYYDSTSRDELETHGAYGISVNDIDNDGWLDIVFSNSHDGASYNIKSYIYWGSSTGFTTRPRTELPTKAGYSNTVIDLDCDGNKDIIFANWYDRDSLPYTVDNHDVPSYVYWGPDFDHKTDLPSHGAQGILVGKISSNKENDVLITNSVQGEGFYGTTFNTWSYIYHGVSQSGFTSCDSVPSTYGHISTKDNGNVHDRGKSEKYNSSVFGNGIDTYTWGACSWDAILPDETTLEMQLRTGNTADPEDESWTTWTTIVKSGNKTGLTDAKYVQYRVISTTNNYYESPVLDKVSLEYQVVTGINGDNKEARRQNYVLIMGTPDYKGAKISYNLASTESVNIKIYNIAGHLVNEPLNTTNTSGLHEVIWNGRTVHNGKASSGIYICRIKIGDDLYHGKIVIMK
jgi:hypothetical protein